MKKKKGSAIVITIVVIALLMVLVMNVILLATNSARISKIYAENNKLRLTARNGIDKGIATLAETSLVWDEPTNSYIVHWSVLAKNKFKFTTTDNIECNVTLDVSNQDKPKIISEATNKDNKKKTITVVLDGKDFIPDNSYVQKIPGNGLTVIGDYANGSISISTPQISNDVDLRVEGDVFAQVGLIKKEHTYIKNISGALTTTGSGQTISGTQNNLNSESYWGLLKATPPQSMMNINMGILTGKDAMGNVIPKQEEKELTFSDATKHKIIYEKFEFVYKTAAGINTNATIGVIKARGSEIGDFNELYHSVVATFPELLKSDKNFLFNKNIPYLVFMIDGDIAIKGNKNVKDGSYTSAIGAWYPSVIMYCTGKLTIQGFITFDNSAVCARSLVIKAPAVGISMLSIWKPDGDHHYLSDGSILPRTQNDKLIKREVFKTAFYNAHKTWFVNDGSGEGLSANYEKLAPYCIGPGYSLNDINTTTPTPNYYINNTIQPISDDSVDTGVKSYITLIKANALKCLTDNLFYAPNAKIIDWQEK